MLVSAKSCIKSSFLLLAFHLTLTQTGFTQSATEDSIKAVVKAETTSYYARNADQWKSVWAKDNKTTRTFVASNGFNTTTGWEKFGEDDYKWIKDNPTPVVVTFSADNYIIRRDGNLAWVEFDQTMNTPSDTATRHSKEQRVLVNQDGKWLIASQVTYEKDSYDATDYNAEFNINYTGYQLMTMNKVKQAIDVFLLNVKLFPKSWNAFDSLGEAYAKAGNKKLAIENYKKSLALNPKSDTGKKALEELMK